MRNLAILVAVLFLFSCSKEPTSWDTSTSLPLLRTSLGIEDLIADSLLSEDENGLVSIRFENEIFNYGLDSLVEVNDDTISNVFSIFPIIEIEVNPGQQFYNQSDLINFDQVEASLRRAIIKAGTIKLQASSPVQGDLLFAVSIPKATKNGKSFSFESIIPAAENNKEGVLITETSLDEYDIDLTGENGSNYNEVEVIYSLMVPDYEDPVTIFGSDEVSLSITFEELQIEFVEGYLGSEEFEFDEKSFFENIKELENTIINLDQASLDLTITNGFGVDVQALFYELEAENSSSGQSESLKHSIIGTNINLNRAELLANHPVPSSKEYNITELNSNIVDLLELIPDSIRIAGRVKLNPFGNISNYNDFASSTSQFKGNVSVNIPLRASISNLKLSDSTAVEWNTEANLKQIVLYLHAASTFKANAEFAIHLQDVQGNTLLNLEDYLPENTDPIIYGADDENQVITSLAFILGENEVELFKSASSLKTELSFETTNFPELVEIESDDRIELLIATDLTTQIEIE